MFRIFCTKQGLDVATVTDELDGDAADCGLLEFDANVPGLSGQSDDERNRELFVILKRCADAGDTHTRFFDEHSPDVLSDDDDEDASIVHPMFAPDVAVLAS